VYAGEDVIMEDEDNRSGYGAFAKLLSRLLAIAEQVNQLLKQELERRARLDEEKRLSSEQEMFMSREFDWEFEQEHR